MVTKTMDEKDQKGNRDQQLLFPEETKMQKEDLEEQHGERK
jgi:hypothetical protein